MHETMRIAVVDDHPLFREGVVRALEREDNIEVVGEGASAADALRLAQDSLPDVILLDVSMPGNGIHAARAISSACPIIRIAMLTVSEDEKTVSAALAAGARGYVLKGVSGRELIDTLWSIANGDSYVSPSLAARLLTQTKAEGADTSGDFDPLSRLTKREEEILSHVAAGLSNREVGDALELTEKTIKHYMTNILQKLQVRNRVAAALMMQSSLAKQNDSGNGGD